MTDIGLASVSGVLGYCKPVMEGANGYACRYRNGQWDYKVTKGVFQAITEVIANGWIKSMGQSYFIPGYRG
nr:garvicin Q family class II bacteriocin [Streptococcus gallolyticus]